MKKNKMKRWKSTRLMNKGGKRAWGVEGNIRIFTCPARTEKEPRWKRNPVLVRYSLSRDSDKDSPRTGTQRVSS